LPIAVSTFYKDLNLFYQFHFNITRMISFGARVFLRGFFCDCHVLCTYRSCKWAILLPRIPTKCR